MITHTVLFRFRDDVLPDRITAVLDEVAALPARHPQMQRFRLGANRSTRDDRMSHGFTVEFATEDGLTSYLTSDHHEAFVRERWRPIVAEQCIVSIDTPAPAAGPEPGAVPVPRPSRPRGPFGMEYARIRVPDLAATIAFLEYHVGLQLEGHDDTHAYLRADTEHHSIELLADPSLTEAETVAVGFSVEDDEVLADLEQRVRDAGHEVLPLDERQRTLCRAGFGVRDPNGLVIELFTEFLEYAEPPVLEYRPRDLVHPFLQTDRYEESLAFYTEVLGFLESDHIEHGTSFLRCEDRYHHSLALSRSDEFQVAHLCFMMKDLDHVMRGRARALYREQFVPSDVVNHSASTSIAFYIQEPQHGPRFELCDGHRVFTPEEHESHRPRRMVADPRNIDVWRPASDDWARF